MTARNSDGSTPRVGDNYVHIRLLMRTGRLFDDVTKRFGLPSTASHKWVVSDSGPLSADEGDYDFPYREITSFAWLTHVELKELRREWSIEPEDAEPAGGMLADLGDGLPRLYPDERHHFDGEQWNAGGWTPVMWAELSIIGEDARPA